MRGGTARGTSAVRWRAFPSSSVFWACSAATDGAGVRRTVLGVALADRRGHKVGDGIVFIGEELRCDLGPTGPLGAVEFRSVTGVSDVVCGFNTLAPVRGSKWLPRPAASDPEDDVVRSHILSSMVNLFTGVCEAEAIADMRREAKRLPTRLLTC